MKMKADAKCLVWDFLANFVNTADGTVKDFNSVYTVITAYKVAKYKRTKTLSARKICHNILNVW